jgi:hypothetical protein
LQDHLAGSVVALDLLEHLEKTHPGTELERFFVRLREDITADRGELEDLMGRMGVSVGTLRKAVGWFAEKAVRIKLRMDDATGGNLQLLEGVEIVAAGLDGKHGLWVALAEASMASPKLRGPDYDRLVQRAIEQRQRIEPVRLDAARAALR